MTTSGRARKSPARRPAEADTSPEKGPLGSGLSAAPDDAQQLREEIEQTRGQLGETVEQLAAKADVKSRAQAKAAEVSSRVKSTASRGQQEAAARAGNARSQLVDKTAAAGHKAVSAGGAGKDELQSRITAAGTPLWEATPESLRRAAAKGASSARQHRVPLAVAAGVLIGSWLAIRWWRKR